MHRVHGRCADEEMKRGREEERKRGREEERKRGREEERKRGREEERKRGREEERKRGRGERLMAYIDDYDCNAASTVHRLAGWACGAKVRRFDVDTFIINIFFDL